jgi:glycosyltransferase involved in cell wall biosynthesis
MTVLQVTHYVPPHHGGIERVADVLFEGYRRAGFDAQWVASRVPRDAPSYEQGRRRVPCVNVLETVLGVPVPIWGPQALRELAASVRAADVVHVHDCQYPGSALAIHLARRYGRPSLLTQHVGFVRYPSAMLNGVERAVYATMGRAVLHSATRIVLATPAAEVHVRQLLGGLPANACTIPNGLDLSRFTLGDSVARREARRALGLSDEDPVVLFAGRLVGKKGVALTLQVAARLPGTHFLMIGDGPLASLMARAPVNVDWIRSVPPPEMIRYYHAADCLLLPSDGEGLPLVVQEALASGVMAVVSDHEPYAAPLAAAGLVRAVPRRVDALVDAVRDASTRRDPGLAAAARRYAERHWDATTMTARYVDIVHDLTTLPSPAN